ncbi:alpha/beta hydrolase family protein [Flavilitoribacter nigricans]|uniref:Alpha/beta hydrolase n=1 Tax=Flavilitoribacter nigricans (strain ATCC 23147 / DSM 23189 / NBRC 102662 / NCIMB 1420 / SS-2) TaxID=1122177 RepID=A0A2D0N6X1_FLAN2|nr:alpha/beta hydrolase [Flavilitoribacter nigricans]PHN03523.1 alpha/beta hydrolase [Flavilitoribacter nigricans DSM 23189 = NBRC 102662]
MRKEEFETNSEDGVILRGNLLIPEQPKAIIQFNCGTATKKEFYLPFLTYLAKHNYLCCLWNYRGSEKNDDLKNSAYTFIDYGTKDMPAIKAYLERQFPGLPLLFIGHSAGGQQIGFIRDLSNVKGNINIAVSSGYYPNMPFGYRMKAYFFFYVFSPISVLLNGFVKAKPYGIMENLPKKVVFQWRDWLEKEDYFFNEKFYGVTVPTGHFKNFQFPIHVIYSTDDTISNAKNTKAFWQNVSSEKAITFRALSPEEFGLKKIDHFGYFKTRMKDKLWTDIVKLLDDLIRG